MKQALLDLLSSKKFQAAILALLAQVLIKKFGMPEASVLELQGMISPLLAYILAQGAADMKAPQDPKP